MIHEIGDNSGFIAACHYDYEADEESDYAASFDSHTQQSSDNVIHLQINNNPRKSIDSSPVNEIFILPEHCYPSFVINNQHPTSKDYQYDGMIDREGNYSIDGWADGSYHESFAVDIALAEMRSDEYDDNYHKDKMIEYRGHDMDNEGVLHTSHTIHIYQIPDSVVQIENTTNYGYLTPDEFGIFRDPEGQARAMDGQVLNISKEDVADIIAMNGPRSFFHTENRAFDQTSIFETSSPSIDSHRELRRKVYDQNSRRKICWERKDEYGIYRDKDVYARAPDGRIIHVSREGIRAILE